MISITEGLQAIYNSNMREKTPLELERENRMLKQHITQLTNNWNELEEFIKDMLFTTPHENQMLDFILDKMKEIKEGNNDK